MTKLKTAFDYTSAALAAVEELLEARTVFPPMRSAHEGYAIILEELDELWEEVRKKPSKAQKAKMRKEAIQVAAMAISFITEICSD